MRAADPSPRILVADDDESVLEVFSRILERSGYGVVRAQNGRAAIEAFDADPSAISLLVTDSLMDSVSGADVASHAWKVKPGLPVIVTSGLRSADVWAKFPRDDRARFRVLQKPFALQDLVDAVARFVEDPRNSNGDAA